MEVELAVARAHAREWAYVLAATARVARDLDLAETASRTRTPRLWSTGR